MNTSKRELLMLAGCLGLLAACAEMKTGTPPPPPPPAPPPSPGPVQPQEPPAGPPPEPLPPATITKLIQSAATLLESAKEAQARDELQRVLAADPTNKTALSLMRQMTADPVAMLGRESFSYTVKPGETLSSIAGRFMGDIYLFYGLARYNGISVPRQLGGGQVLRIPGKDPGPLPAPKPSASPPPPSAPSAPSPSSPASPPPAPPPVPAASPGEQAMKEGERLEKAGHLAKAYAQYVEAERLGAPGATAALARVRGKLVAERSKAARTAFARQDLEGAVRAWDQVLAIDPGNGMAQLERQKALNLIDKLKTR